MILGKLLNWFFGISVLIVGVLNMFYGNDADFGLFLILVSFFYFPPIQTLIKNRLGITIPVWVKIILAIVLVWVNLAIGAISEGYLS